MADVSDNEVFSAREIALVAGVEAGYVRSLMAAGVVATLDGRFASAPDAAAAVRLIRSGRAQAAPSGIFQRLLPERSSKGGPLFASGAIHALLIGLFVGLTSVGMAKPEPKVSAYNTTHLVFVPLPGPGGGGGGGGLRKPAPATRAEMKGTSSLRSPVQVRPVERAPKPEPVQKRTPPPLPEPAAKPVEPAPPEKKPDPVPPVVAPVATVAADTNDRAGVVEEPPSPVPSQGQGAGGGAGSGQGTGMGEGNGPGIGPGSGGGTGGGPFRPGAGITPPQLLREIKPDYTEDARRRGLTGDVILEIIVRSDGSVGDVRMLQGLGGGLDQRAVDAVRQWKFAPARRFGTPVDVIVEVAVEFKLR
jgi:protein TonB